MIQSSFPKSPSPSFQATQKPVVSDRRNLGQIAAGVLAPHPPHLVYAENPQQNEPRSEGGWEVLRWAYRSLRERVPPSAYDLMLILSPHWRTYVGTHILCVPHLKGLSVDPVFPHLFRFSYDLRGDEDFAQRLHLSAQGQGLTTTLMRNPDFRVDYGTLVSAHMINPEWNRPVVALSSVATARYFNFDVMQTQMLLLGRATREAIAASGKRVLVVASHSLSHRHFTVEPELTEDMSKEHITSHNQYLWDMRMIELMRRGQSQTLIDLLPDFTEQTNAETDSGGLSWLLATLDFPSQPARIHGYGSVIGTGNAVVEWESEFPTDQKSETL